MRRTAAVVLAATAGACGSVSGPDAVRDRMPSTPVTVAATASSYQGLELAVSPAGRAVAVWQDGANVVASESDDGFAWRPPRLLADRQADFKGEIALALDDDGNGFAAWGELVGDGEGGRRALVMACRYDAVAGWSTPRMVADEAGSRGDLHLDLAVTRRHAVLVWGWFGSVRSVRWDGYEWSAPVHLESPGRKLVWDVALRMRGETGIAVWAQFDYDLPGQTFVRGREWNPEDGWSNAADLARRPPTKAILHRPVVDSAGVITVLYGLVEEGDDRPLVRAIRHEPGGGWQAPVDFGRFYTTLGLEAYEGGVVIALLPGDDRAPVSAFRYGPQDGWRSLPGPPLGHGSSTLAPGTPLALLSTEDGHWTAEPGDTWRLERLPEDEGRDRSCAGRGYTVNARIGVDASGARTALWRRVDCLDSARIVAWRAPAG